MKRRCYSRGSVPSLKCKLQWQPGVSKGAYCRWLKRNAEWSSEYYVAELWEEYRHS